MELFDAYAAGLFDGEGTVGIYKGTNGKSQKPYWSVRLSISGTYRPMIEKLYDYYEVGLFSTSKRQQISRLPNGKKVYGKQGWRWSVTSKSQVGYILGIWLPMLNEKKEQAIVAMQYANDTMCGEEASKRCKELKTFEFDSEGFNEYAPRRLSGIRKGSDNPTSKINEDVARQIKLSLKSEEKTHYQIAKDFNVSKSIVDHISTGRTWKHVVIE